MLFALSHDLRTPLAALVGLAEMLAEVLAASQPALGEPQRALVDAIHDKSLRMADMDTKLLDMARLQSGAIRLNIEWQSIEEIIGGAPTAPKARPRRPRVRWASGGWPCTSSPACRWSPATPC